MESTNSRIVPDYHGPRGADEQQINRFAQKLREGETMFWFQNVILFTLGAFASIIGPLFIAAILRGIAYEWNLGFPVNGWMTILLVSLIFLPLIYWWEWRTRGQHLEQAIAENRDWFHGRASSYSEWEARQHVAGIMLGTEFILWAPRQVLNAIQRTRNRARLKHVSHFRAAEVLLDLYRCDGGVAIKQLTRHDETVRQLQDILGYLSLLDWIDISKDGRRTWMLSEARKR